MVLKIAVPNKGSLAEASAAALKEAGYRQRSDARDLVLIDPENQVEFYYLRPRDIAIYVGNGELDAGITGRDLLIDCAANAREILSLDFGKSTFRFAAPESSKFQEKDLNGKRIATAYPGLLKNYLAKKNITAEIVSLDGAVESAVRLGVADAIADVVSTGGTLRQAGLKVFGDPILSSEAVLISRSEVLNSQQLDVLKGRLNGVVIARQYVLMDYDIESRLLDKACALTPGFESPTVSNLAKEGWSAVRSMVIRKEVNRVMDELYELGARGILVTDIHACRL
jgi:ATP phosphoribosyltransferase